MEDYHLYFAKVSDVQFLKFSSALAAELANSDEWAAETPDERRGGYTASAKFIKLFGKKRKDRKKLLRKIIEIAIATSPISGSLMLHEAIGPLEFEIHFHNNQINVFSGDRKNSVTLDSTNLDQEIHKIDSLNK